MTGETTKTMWPGWMFQMDALLTRWRACTSVVAFASGCGFLRAAWERTSLANKVWYVVHAAMQDDAALKPLVGMFRKLMSDEALDRSTFRGLRLIDEWVASPPGTSPPRGLKPRPSGSEGWSAESALAVMIEDRGDGGWFSDNNLLYRRPVVFATVILAAFPFPPLLTIGLDVPLPDDLTGFREAKRQKRLEEEEAKREAALAETRDDDAETDDEIEEDDSDDEESGIDDGDEQDGSEEESDEPDTEELLEDARSDRDAAQSALRAANIELEGLRHRYSSMSEEATTLRARLNAATETIAAFHNERERKAAKSRERRQKRKEGANGD